MKLKKIISLIVSFVLLSLATLITNTSSAEECKSDACFQSVFTLEWIGNGTSNTTAVSIPVDVYVEEVDYNKFRVVYKSLQYLHIDSAWIDEHKPKPVHGYYYETPQTTSLTLPKMQVIGAPIINERSSHLGGWNGDVGGWYNGKRGVALLENRNIMLDVNRGGSLVDTEIKIGDTLLDYIYCMESDVFDMHYVYFKDGDYILQMTKSESQYLKCADLNADGRISISDSIMLNRYLAGTVDSLPCSNPPPLAPEDDLESGDYYD